MCKVLVLTRYSKLGASSRLRFFQYIDEIDDVSFDIKPLLNDNYVSSLLNIGRKNQIKNIILSYMSRFFILFNLNRYDVIWVEKEVFPFFPAFAEWFISKINIKFIVDYDDATFHSYDQSQNAIIKTFMHNKIDKVMAYADAVVCGNSYLADRARNSNENVIIIPTVIDIRRYQPYQTKNRLFKDKYVIGWIGSPSTQKYLIEIKDDLERFCESIDNVVVCLVGATESIKHEFSKNVEITILNWSEENECEFISMFDIGIMPLTDDPWSRGKCGYKLIQYLACGKPIIASDVGVNKEIIYNTKSGFAINGSWYSTLVEIYNNPPLSCRLSKNAVTNVEKYYTLQKYISPLRNLFYTD